MDNDFHLLPISRCLCTVEFMLQIDRHFLEDWQKQVTQDYVDRSELPLVDPVASKSKPTLTGVALHVVTSLFGLMRI